ncbi:NADH-dependent flavin oxidoreductase [Lactococcus kimchii]|uniref:NADH-dependent flavin oxidoreductase n=1 Tax=Lactococcus sp. S-13 TaxID=2507158 RepID=UPI00102380B2|nr:NADH-dependent flavin oxidoreductase [Lactococcus sp. S-13]RZI48714.1 NADH-dependent flavin oxidoreductase [Lactococcus sp. S-13]
MPNQLTDHVTLRHGTTLNNRLVMAPMQTHSGLKGGFASEDTIQYYSARSQAAGMLITEFHYVSENGGPAYVPGYPEQLGVYSDAHLEGLRKTAQALKKDGNKAILQIHHAGRAAVGRHVNGLDVVAPSAIEFAFLDYPVRELTLAEIDDIILDFGKATKRAIDAGFDGVEIHGANHYLIQQFFSKLSNLRTDKWGGSLDKRMAFPLAVVKEVKTIIDEYAPKGFIVGYRISPEELHGEEVGYDYKDAISLISEVIKYELDYIHLSLWAGYNSKPKNNEKSYSQLFKQILDDETKLLIVGEVFGEESAADAVENYADLIAVARGTLLDPNFTKKIIEGKGESIIHKISPQTIEYSQLTPGLFEAFSREDSLGLPPLPGGETIQNLHTGKYDI